MNEELKIVISAEVAKLKQGVENAKKHIQSFSAKVAEAKKDVDSNFAAIGTSINNAAKAAGVGVAAMGAALLANVSATEEYRNQQAMLITAFESAGASAETAKTTYNDLYRVMGDSDAATEAAQSLARLTSDEKALGEYTTILTGIWGEYGKGMPIETIAEAVTETAAAGVVTGDLSRALVEAGVNEDAFNEKLAACNTEAEREKLIRETLIGLYADSAATFEANNAQILAQRDAQAALQEKLAELCAALAPVMTAFTAFGAEVLAMVAPYIADIAERLIPLLKTALEQAITAIQTAAQWIKEHETLLAAIGVAIGVVVTAIGLYNAAAAVKAAMAAAEVTSIGALIAAYAAQAVAMAAALAPYLLIAAAIAALIAVIVLCVKHWDEIKAAAEKAWKKIQEAWKAAGEWFKTNIVDKIKKVFSDIGAWFSNLFAQAWKGIQQAWSGVAAWFSSLWKGIQNAFAAVGSWFGSIFTTAYNGIKNAFSSVTSFFSGIWESIKSIFSNVGSAIADGIKGAVSSAVNSILRTAANIINGFISAINFAIGIINAIPGVNIGLLKKLSVPAMAKGGIVDSATLAVIGEQGKEAVLPLENNLEYLDKLAGMISDRMGGGNRPIVLNVDGKRFAEISVESINSLTRQRGSIPLVLA